MKVVAIQHIFLFLTETNETNIHAEYNGEHVVVDLDGNILEGEIPVKKLRMLLTWMDIHQEELIANWNLLTNDDQYFKIEPLK